MRENKYRCKPKEKKNKNQSSKFMVVRSSFDFYFVGFCPYGVTILDELSADDAAAAEAELSGPNGPIVLNADDMRLVIPETRNLKENNIASL